tara:strand:- start:1910 stop:3367 length:1458 start_codon:yes stop_codon:yes gene_type:complete
LIYYLKNPGLKITGVFFDKKFNYLINSINIEVRYKFKRMFKIYHFSNSFVSVEAKNSIITCDPWLGKTTDNAWFSYPIIKPNEVDNKIFNSNFVYISHLHCDHLDFKTLKKFKNKDLTFIIKKFDNGILKKRLKKITNKKIIEIEPFKKKKINKDFTVAIIPQIISNSSDLPDNIDYDLDTSIVIQSNENKTVFYNNVDMPININVLKKINIFIKKEFKKNIDIFCCGLGAASEFPHCFLNINRNIEKKRIIDESLRDIHKYLKYLKPKVFFPAGGIYAIYGKFYKLNKYIAQPNFLQIKAKTKSLKLKVCNIIGGGSINFMKSDFFIKQKIDKKSKDYKEKFLDKIKKIDYYYLKKTKNVDIKKLDQTFIDAKKNYLRILGYKKKIKSKWSINFKIYKNYEITENCFIDRNKSNFLKTYELKNFTKIPKNIFKLECHIEYQLFKSLLIGRFPWNTSLSGSTIMYKRNPNKFNVDMLFSLNFLKT